MVIPPIKSQGIKTKLVPWINDIVRKSGINMEHANWIEPFFGTGVVGFNSEVGGNRVVGDTNPHIIRFYNEVYDGNITPQSMREYLQREGDLLAHAENAGYVHYKEVKNRFNREFDPYDFIFLSRAACSSKLSSRTALV